MNVYFRCLTLACCNTSNIRYHRYLHRLIGGMLFLSFPSVLFILLQSDVRLPIQCTQTSPTATLTAALITEVIVTLCWQQSCRHECNRKSILHHCDEERIAYERSVCSPKRECTNNQKLNRLRVHNIPATDWPGSGTICGLRQGVDKTRSGLRSCCRSCTNRMHVL